MEEVVKLQVYEVYSFSHKLHIHYKLAGCVEMRSRSVSSLSIWQNSLATISKLVYRCCEKSSSGNISFPFRYCIFQALQELSLALFQTNHIHQIDLKHFSTKWLKSNLEQ